MTTTLAVLPRGKRYVRYGVHGRGKHHVMRAEPVGLVNPSAAFDAVCGATARGQSPVTATADVLVQLGKLNAAGVCNRCIGAVEREARSHAG